MTFSIGSQSGGVINNVGGDQTIHGGQHGQAISLASAREAARALTDAAGPDLRPTAEAVESELGRAEPDRPLIARLLDTLARAATRATALLTPLRTLALWLGPLGAPVLALLPG